MSVFRCSHGHDVDKCPESLEIRRLKEQLDEYYRSSSAMQERIIRLESALGVLVQEIRIEVEAKGGSKRQALSRLELAEFRARNVLQAGKT